MNMMLTRLPVLFVILSLTVSLCGCAVPTSTQQAEQAGDKSTTPVDHDLPPSEGLGRYIATLGDDLESDLNASDYLRLRYYYEHVEQMDRQQAEALALEATIKAEVLRLQAVEWEVEVSEEGIMRQLAEIREAYNLALADNADEVRGTLEPLIQGLGITEEEYWTQYLPKRYMQQFRESALFDYYGEKVDDSSTVRQNWEAYITDAIEDYKAREKAVISAFVKEMNER